MNIKQITSRGGEWESVGLAIVLIATGLILVGGDVLGWLSLDRIQNLWPAALIVIGMIDLLGQSGPARRAEPAILDKERHAGQLR
jgi:F0F1-type ATP synthase assembly protein I